MVWMKKVRQDKIKIIKFIYKLGILLFAFLLAMIMWDVSYSPWWNEGDEGRIKLLIIAALYSIVYHVLAKMYHAYRIGEYRLTDLAYFHLLCFGMADMFLYVEATIYYHKPVFILPILKIFIVQLTGMMVVTFGFNRWIMKYMLPIRTIIIYGKHDYERLAKKIRALKKVHILTGCLSEDEDKQELEKAIDNCDKVYLYEVNDRCKKYYINYCENKDAELYITRDIEEILASEYEISHSLDIPFMRKRREAVRWYYPAAKRLADIIFSLCGLIIMSPVLLAVALCIKLYDKGPVLYKQTRLTAGHKTFKIFKFRSMVIDAEKAGAQLASRNDDRITPVGKFIRMTRIDEFPQLLNVIKGDMSIVGPRPERPEIEEEYLKELPEFGLRLKVKAGLTGYAQVFGKYNTTPYDKLRLDLLYINEQSVLLDLKLMVWTIKILFIPESTEGIEDGKRTASDVSRGFKKN